MYRCSLLYNSSALFPAHSLVRPCCFGHNHTSVHTSLQMSRSCTLRETKNTRMSGTMPPSTLRHFIVAATHHTAKSSKLQTVRLYQHVMSINGYEPHTILCMYMSLGSQTLRHVSRYIDYISPVAIFQNAQYGCRHSCKYVL